MNTQTLENRIKYDNARYYYFKIIGVSTAEETARARDAFYKSSTTYFKQLNAEIEKDISHEEQR